MKEKSRVDELLDELLKNKTPEEIVGESGLLGKLTKRFYERALEGEMSAHLGYEKHAPEGRNKKNSRNGKTTKRVKADTSEMELEIPRDFRWQELRELAARVKFERRRVHIGRRIEQLERM